MRAMMIGVLTLAVMTAAQGCKRTAETKAEIVPGPTVTIVGCVAPADQVGGASDTKYLLTDARSKGSKETAGTSGTSAAATYRLDDRDATLAPEVGHEVEIVAVAPVPDSNSSRPKLKVETIKMVAAKC